MKLIVAVVQNADAANLQKSLVVNGYRSTKLGSTGGFLRDGNTTFIIGVADDELEPVKAIIRKECRERTKTVPLVRFFGTGEGALLEPMEVTVGGAVVFVLPLEDLIRL